MHRGRKEKKSNDQLTVISPLATSPRTISGLLLKDMLSLLSFSLWTGSNPTWSLTWHREGEGGGGGGGGGHAGSGSEGDLYLLISGP